MGDLPSRVRKEGKKERKKERKREVSGHRKGRKE
jgi:hypothetical protein